jgi:hypothetical protein
VSRSAWLAALGGLLGAAALGVGLGLASRRGMLAGVREQVPQAQRKIIGDELEDAEARARRAGAQGELEYMGAGMTGIVLCDTSGRAFKVARGDGVFDDDAAWLRVARQMPSTGRHIARLERYDKHNRVLVGECVRGKVGGWKDESKLHKLHQRIQDEMIQYGWTSPEFKADSYVIARGRGPMLVDASMAHRVGKVLVADILDVLAGRRQLRKYERPRDLAWSLRMERNRTVPAATANRILARLKERFPDVEIDD